MTAVLRHGALGLFAVLALAACQLETTGAGGAPNTSPRGAALDSAACEAGGGTVVFGLAGPQCARPQPDAGKACTSNSDCAGLCLAKTQSCAPVTPFFGCHEVLANGSVATICID
ncbi:hypothetical protein [uncultured Lentibacter sp.]|uniref:hypothetical protein n=1 Tax=uncultured Lentibacter sp. TaxID=1659309 RepID=UPI00260A510F|nr:hypothetical protein [uncultured Lentibacter sp.]